LKKAEKLTFGCPSHHLSILITREAKSIEKEAKRNIWSTRLVNYVLHKMLLHYNLFTYINS